MSETFGQALRRLRGSRSVRDVAQLANCGKSIVSALENGTRKPTAEIAAALDDALGAGDQLKDLAAAEGTSPRDQAAALQNNLAETLAAGPMTDAGVEDWEYTVARHGRATRYRPAGEHLGELTRDFAALHRLLKYRHPPPVRRKLLTCAAQMSGVMALTLLKVGDPSSHDWWRTGRAAATAAEDRATLSWINAQESYELYYGGNIEGATELAIRAQDTAGALPCVGPALAAPLEARAHALARRSEDVIRALARAEEAFRRLGQTDRIDSALGYNEDQLRFHSGNAWTHLGDTARAGENHVRALELYPSSDRSDRAFVRLDQAQCLLIDGDPATATDLAANIILELPAAHRDALIVSRGQQLLTESVSVARGQFSEARRLREALSLPPDERDE